MSSQCSQRVLRRQGNFALVPSVLTGDIPVELGQETHESLVMQWDPLEDRTIMPVAAWELAYPETYGLYWNLAPLLFGCSRTIRKR